MTAERYEFLPHLGERLLVGWHLPEPLPPSVPLVAVLASPLHEEKKAAHRPLVDLARALAARGLPCVRFDYRGSGDSTGEPTAVTLTTMREDLSHVLREAMARLGAASAALVGVRLGADAAGLVAEEAPEVSRLVLVVPVGKGSRYVSQARLRSKIRGALTGPADGESSLEERGGFDFDGHPLSPEAIGQLETHNLAARTASIGARVLCLDLCAREKPTAVLEALAEALHSRVSEVRLRAVVEEPFWNALGPVEPLAFQAAVIEELCEEEIASSPPQGEVGPAPELPGGAEG
jgi:pimeloyl-ACP methyl ester carboxylesterase